MIPVGARVRELRIAAGLSQQELGELAGVRQATISELESGKAQGATFETLGRLAEALRVPAAELFTKPKKRT